MSQEDAVFFRTLTWGMGLLTLFFVAIIILARVVTADEGAGVDERQRAAIEECIAPVGQVSVGSVQVAAASGAAAAADPKQTYQQACFACHGTGAAGAPKLGDKGAWSARITKGNATLYDNAIKGFKGMPPKGGRADLSDDTVKAVVDFMVAESK